MKKRRYCKFCGHEIDSETKKCSHCDKQYFRLPRRMDLYVVSAITVILIALNIYQYICVKNLSADLAQAKKDYGLMKSAYSAKCTEYDELWEKHLDLMEDAHEAGVYDGGIFISRVD